MIRVNKITDYGVVILGHVARRPAGWVCTTRELADDAGLPVPTAGKILKILTQGGFLVSKRGSKGGYRLARLPEEISVYDVITCFEGPMGVTDCSMHKDACTQAAKCPVTSHWQRINRAILGALDRVSLAELVRPSPVSSAAADEKFFLDVVQKELT